MVELPNHLDESSARFPNTQSCAQQNHGHSNERKTSTFPWRAFSIAACLPFALLPIVVLAAAAEVASQSYLNGRPCYPNGLWKEAPGATWRIMDSSYFFTPNLSFGAMTFTQVKVIDITWDLLVGRGGQMLLAWVNYRVFNEWLVYHMERWPTSYKMYTSLAFQTTTLGTLGVLGREWLAYGDRSWTRFFRWFALLAMLIGTLYVLAFPTLMAAMTGYITTYEPYVEDESGNLVAWTEVQEVEYVVQDSGRLGEGYPQQLVSVKRDVELADAILNYSSNYLGIKYDPVTRSLNFSQGEFITSQRNVSSTFVFNDTAIPLSPPTLNITFALERPEADRPSPGLSYPIYSLDASRQGPVVSASYVYNHGSCKPSETYQWGFSYIFLFMVSIFNFVWSCIMAGMWMDTRIHSRMYQTGRRPGLLRSILDIADAMKQELGSNCSAEEEVLKKVLNKSGGALIVSGEELMVARTTTEEKNQRKSEWRRRLTKGSTF